MNVSVFIVLILCVIGVVEAKEHDYERVILAGTGDVGELLVRFLVLSGEPCLIIQNLAPGGRGKVSSEKDICSIDGEKFEDGYTAVEFKSGTFKDGRLVLEVGVTPLQPIGETVFSCEVVFFKDLAERLSCKEKKRLDEKSCAVSENSFLSLRPEVSPK